MEVADALKIGQDVNYATSKTSKGGAQKLSGKVKKIKDNLVAVNLEGAKDKDSIAVGDKVLISWNADGFSHKTKGDVIQNKTFPIVVTRVRDIVKVKEDPEAEKAAQAEEEERGPNYDPDFDKKYVKASKPEPQEGPESERQMARVEDGFPIHFFAVEKSSVEEKKVDYLSRRSKERRDESKASHAGLEEGDVLKKLASANPRVTEVIMDLYQKYAALSEKVFKKEVKGGGDESTGTCVDLSGTGFQFLTKQQILPKTIMKFIINPPASPPFSISVLGEVMRVERKKDPLDRKTKYAYGTRFYAIHEDDREEFIQYTFKRQQEILKRRRAMAGYD